jgi:hypothetical protein
MPDWPTIIASGTAGAVAGAIVSWVAAPHLAKREERGQARLEAQKAIRATVEPILTEVRQYQAHTRSSLGRDPEDHALHIGDLNLCARLLQHAERLSFWRRHLVINRLKRLFGPKTVDMYGIHGQFAADAQSSLGVMIATQYNASMNPEQFSQPDRGTYDASLRCGPDSVQIAALIASLEHLRDSR